MNRMNHRIPVFQDGKDFLIHVLHPFDQETHCKAKIFLLTEIKELKIFF